jgi:hypothetical protein
MHAGAVLMKKIAEMNINRKNRVCQNQANDKPIRNCKKTINRKRRMKDR